MRRALASLLVATLGLPQTAYAYAEVAMAAERPMLSAQQALQSARGALSRADLAVALCALDHPDEAAQVATRGGRSLDVRVVIFASGTWRIALGSAAAPMPNDEALQGCIQAALRTELGTSLLLRRPLERTTEVRRRFTLSHAATATEATRVRRAVARQHAAFEACVEGMESAVQVHYETMPHGFVQVVNVDGLPEARFSERVACLQQAASEVRGIPRHVVLRETLSIMPAAE